MPEIPTISEPEAVLAHAAAQCVVETHRRLVGFVRGGVTLAAVDAFVARTLADLGCRSCFLGYKLPRFPQFPSHACLSLNDCIVHGTAGLVERPLTAGDVLKIDVGVWHRGWIGDAAWTYSIGRPAPEVRRLMDCGKECLRLGIATLRPPNTLLEWARAVQGHAEKSCGFHLIRKYGGHGYGRRLHAPPHVSNVLPDYPNEWPDLAVRCVPGMLLAVEPMVCMGTAAVRDATGRWPVYTADGSVSVHYEADVLVTEAGPRVLTHGLEDLPDELPA